MQSKAIVLLACAAGLALTACASTPGSRIKENEALFDAYQPDVQAAIRAGQIRQGFDVNQVYMALGEPDHKRAEGDGQTWLYTRVMRKKVTTKKDVYKYELERKEYEEKIAHKEYAVKPSMEEVTILYRTEVTRVVKFQGGQVVGWDEPTDQWLGEWHQRT